MKQANFLQRVSFVPAYTKNSQTWEKASQHDIGFVKPKRLTNAERLDRDQSWLQRAGERDALHLARMRLDDQHKCFIPLNQGEPAPRVSAELYCTVFDTIHGLPVAAFQPELIWTVGS